MTGLLFERYAQPARAQVSERLSEWDGGKTKDWNDCDSRDSLQKNRKRRDLDHDLNLSNVVSMVERLRGSRCTGPDQCPDSMKPPMVAID